MAGSQPSSVVTLVDKTAAATPQAAAAAVVVAPTRTECLLQWLASKVGVRETTGRNDGAEIEAWQKLTGNRKGDPYCGSFQAASQKHCSLPFPKGAGGSYNWFLAASKRTLYIRGLRGSTALILPTHKVGFYYPWLKRIGHIGSVESRTRRGFITVEGNTGQGGGRDGAGVYRLSRSAGEIYASANWTN